MKTNKSIFHKLWNDTKGAALVYISLAVALIFAFVGLAIDVSRLTMTHTQARAAAEAAAIAGARQLDGSPNSITRADAAATTFVARDQRFGEQAAAGNIVITMRYLTDLPDDDDAPIPGSMYIDDPTDPDQAKLALYAEATTEVIQHDNFFLPAIGVASSRNLNATAVAGQTSAVCRVTPLAICNPAENGADTNIGANFKPEDWKGRQILVRTGGEDGKWAPGNFGLLDSDEGQGTPNLDDQLAGLDGADKCFSLKLDTKPGSVSALRSALNVRFDIYDQPFHNDKSNVKYPPAENVTKGAEWTPQNINNNCGTISEPPGYMGLTEDQTFTNGVDDDGAASGGKFGEGDWDCLAYWNINHPGVGVPDAGCTGITAGVKTGYSRYEVYRYEIDHDMIPGKGPTETNGPEDGKPVCYDSDTLATIDYDNFEDRRVLHFAVMNCREHEVKGNSPDVPAEAVIKAFITEPAIGNGNDVDVFLEVVDVVEAGDDDGALKEYVEILR